MEDVVVLDLSDDEAESIQQPTIESREEALPEVEDDIILLGDGIVKDETKPQTYTESTDAEKVQEEMEKAQRLKLQDQQEQLRKQLQRENKSKPKATSEFKVLWTPLENPVVSSEDDDDNEDILADSPRAKSKGTKRKRMPTKTKHSSKSNVKPKPVTNRSGRQPKANASVQPEPNSLANTQPVSKTKPDEVSEILDDSDDEKFETDADFRTLKDPRSRALLERLAASSRSRESLLHAQQVVPEIEPTEASQQPEPPQPREENPDDKVELTVVDGRRDWSKKFIVFKIMPFKDIMSAAVRYYQSKGHAVDRVDLYFDGYKLDPSQCPSDMNMTSGDQIDAKYGDR